MNKNAKIMLSVLTVAILALMVLPAVTFGREALSQSSLYKDHVTVTFHAVPSQDTAAFRTHMIYSGWLYAGNGNYVSYTHNLMTNVGHTFLANRAFAVATNTSATTSFVKYVALTSNTTYAGGYVTDGANGNNVCGATGSGTGTEITTNGLSRVAGTITIGTASAGSIATTVTNTFTATGSSNVYGSCLETSATLTGSGAGTNVFEASFASFVPLNSGDSLALTWTVTMT